MTLTTTTSRVSYPGTGTSGPFTVPFRFDDAADLLVTKREDATYAETTLTETTDFTVTGEGNPTGALTTVAVVAAGYTLIIRRAPSFVQSSSFRDASSYFGGNHEDALDRIAMLVQELKDESDRSFRLLESIPGSSYITKIRPETGKVLGFGASGLEAQTLDSSAIALPGAGRTVATVSAYLSNNAIFNVKDYGATGDGVTNDRTAIAAAIAAANANGFGEVYIPAGTYVVSSSIALLNKVRVRGAGWNNTTLKRGGGGNAVFTITAANDQYIEGIRFDGNAVAGAFITYTDANGLYSGTRDLWFTNYPTGNAAITFANDGGNSSSHERLRFEPTGTGTTVGAIGLGTDSGPCYRMFYDCLALNGNPLIDFAGSEMTWVVGGGGNYVVFSSGNAKKAVLIGVRIATGGGTLTVKGVNHAFTACPIAGPVVFDNTTQGCAYSANEDQGVTDDWVATGASGTPNLINRQGDTSVYNLTDAATIATDALKGKYMRVTLAGNRTVDLPTNLFLGKEITYEFTQDGTGGRTVAFHATFKHGWSNVGNTAGKISTITFVYNGTNLMQKNAQSPYV